MDAMTLAIFSTVSAFYNEWVETVDRIAESPLTRLILIILITILLYQGYLKLLSVFHWKRDKSRRDKRREFPAKMKQSYVDKCGGRCENVFWWGGRCRNRSQLAGDHWYPHARGGATTEKNLVILCQSCNSRKSAKIPGFIWTIRITWSRKLYGLPKPGDWM